MLVRTVTSKFAAWIALPAIVALGAAPISAKARPKNSANTGSIPHISHTIVGSLPTRDGQRLRLYTALGSVHVHTGQSGKVDYRVLLETDANQPDAQKLLKDFSVTAHPTSQGAWFRGETSGRRCTGRLWVTFDVTVPRSYNLEVTTQGGNIESSDINGRVSLTTAGGNITVGSVQGATRLEANEGGHISIKDVNGDLVAYTRGGHITAGNVSGTASLHTGGGHIRVASVGGLARLDTGGGNVSVEKAGGELIAETAAGQIEVGEAERLVHARTGGGGIRIVQATGAADLTSDGGSIYLTQVNNAVHASTDAGGITAWFANAAKFPGGCQFESSQGDIVVYIPKQMPITIDAAIQLGDEHHLFVDPALPLKVSYANLTNGERAVRAAGALNGGGEVLKLRTVAGNIRLIMSDTTRQLQIFKQQMDQIEKKMREIEINNQGVESTEGPTGNN